MRLIVEIWIQKTKTKFELERESTSIADDDVLEEISVWHSQYWWIIFIFLFSFWIASSNSKSKSMSEWNQTKKRAAYSFELNFRPKEAKSNEWNWIELKWKWKRERRKEKPRRRKLQQGKRVPFFSAIYIFSFFLFFFSFWTVNIEKVVYCICVVYVLPKINIQV